MLQQPLARRVAGAARYAAAGEALPGALPLSSMRRRARGLRAAPFQPMERQMPGGPSGRGFYAALDRPAEPSLTNGRPHLRVVGSRRTRPRKAAQ